MRKACLRSGSLDGTRARVLTASEAAVRSTAGRVPEPWAGRLVAKGFVRADGTPNVSLLARKAGVAVETARRAIHDIGTPSPETVARLMAELGPEIQDWVGQRVDLGPYEPPSEAALLTKRERRALDQLIRAIAERNRSSANGL